MLEAQGQAFWRVKKNVLELLLLEVACIPEGKVDVSTQ